ncbi:MAG: hypothetical protein NVS2B15_14570 [Pseudarthrobacter sp.]
MLKHVDFLEQVHSAGSDSTIRPDLVVQLPGQKQLVVDAKVPLASYLEAQDLGSGAGSEQSPANGQDAKAHASRQTLLAAHAKALRAHVDALSNKKYWDIPGNSPEHSRRTPRSWTMPCHATWSSPHRVRCWPCSNLWPSPGVRMC